MKLSTIVLSFNSFILKGGFVQATLESINAQDSGNFEVILVNNSSVQDERYDSLSINRGEIPYKLINTNNTSRGEARNVGANIATGDYLLFIDDDTIILDDDAFSKVIGLSGNFRYGFGARRFWAKEKKPSKQKTKNLIAKIRNHNKSSIISTEEAYLPELFNKTNLQLHRYSFPGNFGFVEKRLFNAIGGFDKRFKKYGGEDDYLAFLMFKEDPSGFKLLYNSLDLLHLTHDLPKTTTRRFNKGGNIQIYKKALESQGVRSFDIEKLFGLYYDNNPIINMIHGDEI